MNVNKFFLPLDLQFFADEGATGDKGGTDEQGQVQQNGSHGGQQNDQNPGNGDQKQNTKTFSQDEVNKIISERLSKERQKWEKEFQTKLDEAKTEAEKLAKMNAEQKAEYERKKREEELNRREAEITRRELRATALETLAEKGLPKQLADILVYTDAGSCKKSIENVEKVFRDAVEQAVNERLKGGKPPQTGGQGLSNLEAELSKYFQ